MVTQQSLKNIQSDLDKTFSVFSSVYEIMTFVEQSMRRYLIPGAYTDYKCEEVFRSAVSHIENDINEKYKKILSEVNIYLKDIEQIAFGGSYSSSYSQNDMRNLAIGAGAGLGAAFIFSGPFGWLAAIGVGIGLAVNSDHKKKELIDRIFDCAKKLNEEAKEKIRVILDKLILPEPKLIENFTQNNDMVVLQPKEEILSPEQKEIKDFLEYRHIKYLVHFTKLKNLELIKRYGIVSAAEARRNGFNIEINDNGLSAHRIDRYLKCDPDDYVYLSVTNKDEDLLSAYRYRDGGTSKYIAIYLDASLLWKEIDKDRCYCDMNASCGQVSGGNDIQAFKNMFRSSVEQWKNGEPEISTRQDKDFNEPTHKQAQILFEKKVDFNRYVKKVERI